MDFSDDRLIELASSLVDEHNYIGALKILNKNAECNYNDADSYRLYAEIFDDMGIPERAINYWFRCMDNNPDDLAEVYEGLAVAYMTLGNDEIAAYYYNKLLSETDGTLSPEARREVVERFFSKTNDPLKIAYPPKEADFSKEIQRGIKCMTKGQYERAISLFEEVAEGNPRYFTARNYIAMCHIMNAHSAEAEAECLSILEKKPDDVQALTTLSAVKVEQNDFEGSVAIARRLLALGTTDQDDIYKIATVCCENKLHAEAFELLCKLEGEFQYDTAVLYFKAVSAYNSGNIQACYDAFDTLLTIKPDAVVARYYYQLVREDERRGTTRTLSYYYRMPEEERDQAMATIAKFCGGAKRSAARGVHGAAKKQAILESVKWAYDEIEDTEYNQMHFVAAMCAVRSRNDDFVRDILLDGFISDDVKMATLHELCIRNEDNQFGVVICNIYSCVDIYRLNLGRKRRKNFIVAYAMLTSQLGMLGEDYSARFCGATERLYAALEKASALDLSEELHPLAAAIFSLSMVKDPSVPSNDVCAYFGADRILYKAIMDLLE